MPLENISQIQRPSSKKNNKKKDSNNQRHHTIQEVNKFTLADKFYYLKTVCQTIKTTLDSDMLVNL